MNNNSSKMLASWRRTLHSLSARLHPGQPRQSWPGQNFRVVPSKKKLKTKLTPLKSLNFGIYHLEFLIVYMAVSIQISLLNHGLEKLQHVLKLQPPLCCYIGCVCTNNFWINKVIFKKSTVLNCRLCRPAPPRLLLSVYAKIACSVNIVHPKGKKKKFGALSLRITGQNGCQQGRLKVMYILTEK